MFGKFDPRNHVPGHTDFFADKVRGVIWVISFVAILLFVDLVSNLLGAAWNIRFLTPIALLSLNAEHYWGLVFTAIATGFGFFIAVILGSALGILAASLKVMNGRGVQVVGASISKVFDFFYIVPIVVTLGLAFALLLPYAITNYQTWIIAVGTITVATFILGGYQVFEAIYRSAVAPSEKNLILVDSIYSGRHRWRVPGLPSMRDAVTKVLRLKDTNVQAYTNAVVRAFHLSLVSVVIVESVRPAIYEYIFPQTGIIQDRYGGVGQMILSAQGTAAIDTIVGLIWALFLFDAVVVLLIEKYLHSRYLKHYQG